MALSHCDMGSRVHIYRIYVVLIYTLTCKPQRIENGHMR